MRTKTKYREIESENIPVDIPPVEDKPPELPVDLPTVEIDGKEPESIAAVTVDVPPEGETSEAVTEALQKQAEADEAAAALRKQIAAIHEAETLQRQHAAAMMAAQRPMSRDEKIEFWKSQGLSSEEAKFLQANPDMIDHSAVVNHAAALALQAGCERDSQDYFEAVRSNFDKEMERLQVQASSPQVPEFFRAPPPKAPALPNRSAYLSAPVSREVPTGGPRELTPSQVRLSAEEQEIARASGISLKTYAEMKLRLEREKASGQRQ